MTTSRSPRRKLAQSLASAAARAPAFTEMLEAEASAPGLRKGERTRLAIRAATARALASQSYAALTMDHIAVEAGVSRAAVYQYAKSKEGAVSDVLIAFHARTLSIPVSRLRGATPYETIRCTNRYYIDYFAKNAIFMERVRELREILPELIAEKQRVNSDWARRVVGHARRHGASTASTRTLHLRALMLECMIDDVLREVFVVRNPALVDSAQDLDELADELTEIWFRALYGK